MLTPAVVLRHDPVPSRAALQVAWWGWRLLRAAGRLQLQVEGADSLPSGPCVLACNGSHWYDPLPYRAVFYELGRATITVGKGKLWHKPLYRPVLARLGALPLASRGYLLAMDFRAVHGRLPDDEEYRALRAYLDGGSPPAGNADLRRLLDEPRTICGVPFDPARASYRNTVLSLYRALQQLALDSAWRAVGAGYSLQIYPAGTVSVRLSRGHPGAVQLAHALRLPLVPVGMSGTARVFPRPDRLRLHPGTLTVRFGTPWRPDLALSPGFSAFDPAAEATNASALQAATDELMERINALLDPEYQWAPGHLSDGRSGAARFL